MSKRSKNPFSAIEGQRNGCIGLQENSLSFSASNKGELITVIESSDNLSSDWWVLVSRS
jgi:hypothetical protein